MYVREYFNPVLMAANATYAVRGPAIGGFLAKTAGTVSVTAPDNTGLTTATYVDAIPVAAGTYLPIPLSFPTGAGGSVILANGASGTLFV